MLHIVVSVLKCLRKKDWTSRYLLAQIPSAPKQTATNLPRREILQLLVGVAKRLVDSPVLLVLHVLEITLQRPEKIRPRSQ